MPVVHKVRGALRLVAAALAVAGVEVALRTIGLAATCRRLGVRLPTDVPPAPTVSSLPAGTHRWVRAVRQITAHWPFGGPCLREALAVAVRCRGRDTWLQIGVPQAAIGSAPFRAHAWLVIDGLVYDATAADCHTLSPAAGREPLQDLV